MAKHLIKVYHWWEKGKIAFSNFLEDISKTLEDKSFSMGLHYSRWEFFYSLEASNRTYPWFESQFYTHFNDFQIVKDTKWAMSFDEDKSVVGTLHLQNNRFYPFKLDTDDNSDFIFNLFRTFENFDVMNDKVAVVARISPIKSESTTFFLKASLQYWLFKIKLSFQFFKYMFNFKIQKNWKAEGNEHFRNKLQSSLFKTQLYIVCQSSSKASARAKIDSIFQNFQVFKNYPLNQFRLKVLKKGKWVWYSAIKNKIPTYYFSSEELSNFLHFPQNPKKETSLMTVKARKLALPIWVPTYEYTLEKNEVLVWETPDDVTVLGVTDYRSITVPVGIPDEDRLRHVYIVGQTGVGKSKFMQSLMISDLRKGKWIWVIDPHGDLIEEIIQYIPEERKKDVILFDPTDEKFPFCLNPLDVQENESKQILAKWFIDIFKKFFWANWNPKLEHVLRMIFLALLDKENATLFDIIRALTDKDFRYDMIDAIQDDVVRNFRTNEFAWRSQQFNTEAIMPILNKVGQLLSIDILKNIFASPENKLDFRQMMDEQKILLVKVPKGKLQEEIMWFLWAMFVTKIYQTAMWRQGLSKKDRTPFFLYVDEFQNFATETFSEILSEARKYGLGLCVAHQFIRQIPESISQALFGNVATKISFRIASDDAWYMKEHFDPFLDSYDLANLNMREFYIKTMIQGKIKDPFSLRSAYTPDVDIDHWYIDSIREISREKYNRTLEEAKKVIETEQSNVLETIEEFAEPLI